MPERKLHILIRAGAGSLPRCTRGKFDKVSNMIKNSGIVYRYICRILVAMEIAALLSGCLSAKHDTTDLSTPSPAVFVSTKARTAAPTLNNESRVTITHACSEFLLPIYQDLVREFERAYPHIRVRLHPIPDDIWSRGKPAQEIDYEILSSADTAEWLFASESIEAGWVLALGPLIEADSNFDRQDFYPNLLESLMRNERIWAIPVAGSVHVLYYDRNILDAAGVDYPTEGWTRDDLLDMAQRLIHHEGDQVIRYGLDDKAGSATIWGQAAAIGDPEDPASLFGVEMADFLRWYTDLHLEYEVMPVPGGLSAGAGPSAMRRPGVQAAMWIDFAANLNMYLSRESNIGVAPLPQGWPASWFLATSLAISSGTPHPQTSWTWLDFVSRHRPLGGAIVPAGFDVLARRSVAASTFFWEGLASKAQAADQDRRFAYESYMQTLKYAVEHQLVAGLNLTGLSDLTQAVRDVYGGAPVDQALAQAKQSAVQAYREAQQMSKTAIPIAVSTRDAEASRVSLTFVVHYPLAPAMFEQSAQAFQQAHPDIDLDITTSHSGNPAGDCFAGFIDVDDPLQRENVLSLEPLLEQEAGAFQDFYPTHLEAFHHEGTLWGIPLQAVPTVIYYNQDLFDQAGLPYPQAGWTWANFEQTAQTLTYKKGDVQQYGYAPRGMVWSDWFLYLSAHGLALWDAQGKPQFDSRDVARATERYFEFAREAAVPMFLDEQSGDCLAFAPSDERIANNQVAMWAEDAPSNPRLWSGAIRYGAVPMPVSAARVTRFTCTGLYISSRTTSTQACWFWIKYLSENWIPDSGLPSRRSVALSEQFADRVEPEIADVLRESAEYTSVSFDDLASWAPLNDALRQIWQGGLPSVALSEAQSAAGP